MNSCLSTDSNLIIEIEKFNTVGLVIVWHYVLISDEQHSVADKCTRADNSGNEQVYGEMVKSCHVWQLLCTSFLVYILDSIQVPRHAISSTHLLTSIFPNVLHFYHLSICWVSSQFFCRYLQKTTKCRQLTFWTKLMHYTRAANAVSNKFSKLYNF
jgi:hypothetical protein